MTKPASGQSGAGPPKRPAPENRAKGVTREMMLVSPVIAAQHAAPNSSTGKGESPEKEDRDARWADTWVVGEGDGEFGGLHGLLTLPSSYERLRR